jgi:hypothetical protein
MMLFVTLIALAGAAFLMYKDHAEYGSKSPPKEAAPTLPKLGDSAPSTKTDGGGGGDTKVDPKGMGMDMGMGMGMSP